MPPAARAVGDAERPEIGEERDATGGMARFLLLPQHGYSPARRRGLEHG